MNLNLPAPLLLPPLGLIPHHLPVHLGKSASASPFPDLCIRLPRPRLDGIPDVTFLAPAESNEVIYCEYSAR